MVRVEFKGLREIQASIKELPKTLNKAILNKILLVGALLIRDEARKLAPVLETAQFGRKPGTLRKNIIAMRVKPDQYAATTLIRVRKLKGSQIRRFKQKTGLKATQNPNDAYYWRFVEFGTSKMPAHSFLRAGFEAKKYDAVKKSIAMAELIIQKELARFGRKTIARL
jgi:HK97 gp10 family phage protein